MSKVRKLMEVKEFIQNNWDYYKQFIHNNEDRKFFIKKIYWNMDSHGHLNKFFKKMDWDEGKAIEHIEEIIGLM